MGAMYSPAWPSPDWLCSNKIAASIWLLWLHPIKRDVAEQGRLLFESLHRHLLYFKYFHISLLKPSTIPTIAKLNESHSQENFIYWVLNQIIDFQIHMKNWVVLQAPHKIVEVFTINDLYAGCTLFVNLIILNHELCKFKLKGEGLVEIHVYNH